MPVLRDIDPPRDPDLVMPLDVIEETRQRSCPPGTPDEPAVQAYRQHLWLVQPMWVALGIQHVECVFQVVEELGA